jgi:hypothetical protein
MGEINFEKEYLDLRDRYNLVSSVLNVKPVKNKCTDELEKFHVLLTKDFLTFTQGESTMHEDAIAHSRLQEVEKELTDSVNFPMLSTKNIVAVAGGFSSGKSKFLNTIIYADNVRLSTGINPVTAIPTFVQQGEEAKIIAYSPDGRQGEIPVELFNKIDHQFIEKLGFNLKSIMPYSTVTAPFVEKLKELSNVCFIDTPGYDAAKNEETQEDSSAAFDSLQKATAILWFIDIDNGTLHKKDINFLHSINAQGNAKKLFVVVSRADRKKSTVQNVIDRIKDDLEENDIPYDGISAYSSNEKKEYLDEDDGKSIFDWLKEQNKNLIDPAEKIRLLRENVESVFQMYHKSIEEDIKKIENDKKTIEKILFQTEKRIDAKDKQIRELERSGNNDYYANRNSHRTLSNFFSPISNNSESSEDNDFDEGIIYNLVNDRTALDKKNDKEAYRICREMQNCIDRIFNEMNSELLKNLKYQKFCTKCGAKLKPNSNFCTSCGKPVK